MESPQKEEEIKIDDDFCNYKKNFEVTIIGSRSLNMNDDFVLLDSREIMSKVLNVLDWLSKY